MKIHYLVIMYERHMLRLSILLQNYLEDLGGRGGGLSENIGAMGLSLLGT